MSQHKPRETTQTLAEWIKQENAKPNYEELEAELRVTRDKLLAANLRIKQLERQATDDGWAMDNYREDQRRQRDYEIGQMGGGG